jgi:flagellar hook-associated protein 1 FlgK
LVSSIGSKIESVNSATTAQSSVVTQAQSKRAEKVGVNLNEELSDLIKYQRAYEASARVFSVASELMQTLVNLAK